MGACAVNIIEYGWCYALPLNVTAHPTQSLTAPKNRTVHAETIIASPTGGRQGLPIYSKERRRLNLLPGKHIYPSLIWWGWNLVGGRSRINKSIIMVSKLIWPREDGSCPNIKVINDLWSEVGQDSFQMNRFLKGFSVSELILSPSSSPDKSLNVTRKSSSTSVTP